MTKLLVSAAIAVTVLASSTALASQAVSPTAPNTTASNGVAQQIAASTPPTTPVVMRAPSRMDFNSWVQRDIPHLWSRE